jgi:dolichol-phosphate mannosyltransferase
MNTASNFSLKKVARRYSQFCLVGGSGVVVDMVIMWLLAAPDRLGWNLTLSKIVAAEIAIFNNFLWNDVWTFRGLLAESAEGSARWSAWLARFGRFNLICATGIGMSVLLLNAQVCGFGMSVHLSNLIAIVIVSVWNFVLNLRFGWVHRPSQASIAKELQATG